MATTRKRLAPAAAMTAAVLGSLLLGGGAIVQLRAQAQAHAVDVAHATAIENIRERLLAPSGLLVGVLANDTPRMDTLEVLEVTPDGVTAYALITGDDVLVIGLLSPADAVAMSSSPGIQREGVSATLDIGDGRHTYDLDVWREGTGFGHELIVQ